MIQQAREDAGFDHSPNYYVYLVTAIGALSGLLFGFDTGVIAGGLIFINQTFDISVWTQQFIVASVVLGAFLGALLSGRLADWLGRRTLLIYAAIAFILGTLWVTFTVNVFGLIGGRFILGLAIGVSSFTAPLLISEMAPARLRGALVLLNIVAITFGEVLAHWVNYLFEPSGSWRMMFGVGIIPAVVLLIGMAYLPETPRYLVLKGYFDQARDVLKRLGGDQSIDKTIRDIQLNLNRPKGGWKDILAKRVRPVLIIGLMLGIFQQGVGINTVMYYGPTIFREAGFQQVSTQVLATMGMAIVNTLGTILAVFIVDKIGRRRLLIIGSALAAVSLGVVAVGYSGILAELHLQSVAVLGLGFYMLGYSISLGALFWLLISEIFPLHIRGLAMSFVTAMQWLANFVVASTFLSLIEHLGAGNTFWFYGLVALSCALFCYYFVPETKGVTLEQIEVNLDAGKASRDLGQPINP